MLIPERATNIVAIDAGDIHTVALRNDGRTVYWSDEPGGGSIEGPTRTNLVAIACSSGSDPYDPLSIAVRENGSIVTAGGPFYGQLPGSNYLVRLCGHIGSVTFPPGLTNVGT